MPSWTKDEDAMCMSEMPIAEIAAQLGRSVDSVRNRRYILRDGVKPSPTKSPSRNLNFPETIIDSTDNFINIVCASERMLSLDDVIRKFNIDLDLWEVERYRAKTSEGYRKDRRVEWHVEEGTVIEGHVNDSGKMLVVPLYHIEVRLKKKIRETKGKDFIEALIEDAKSFMPKYVSPQYPPRHEDGCMLEIGMPDIHFGRLCWAEESGINYDIKIAEKVVDEVLGKLLNYAKPHEIDKILLPLGNDFFNSDTISNTTTRGTPQQEDVRWQKTFRAGVQLAIKMIDQCTSIAPTDVLIIPGNHDNQRSFYLGEALSLWYSHNSSVTILNSAKTRKYYPYGKNLIGFAHGSDEKLAKLPIVMAIEVPDLWANSVYREWHTGHLHRKKEMTTNVEEENGVVVRILRSLVPADAWTFNQGFVASLKAGEAFLWHPTDGLIAQFTATPTYEE